MSSHRRFSLCSCLMLVLLSVANALAEPVSSSQPYPDDAFSRPAIDRRPTFETLVGCTPATPVLQRAEQFEVNELRLLLDETPPATQWRVQPKQAANAALVLSERISRAPQSISLQFTNHSAKPVSATLQMHELGWRAGPKPEALVWVVGEPQRVEAGATRECSFSCSKMVCPSKPDARPPQYPVGMLIVNFDGLEPGKLHEFVLRDLVVRYAPPAVDASLQGPSSLQAGSDARFTVKLASCRVENVDIEVHRDAWTLWRIRLAEKERAELQSGSCIVQRQVPWWLSSGKADAAVVLDGYRTAHAPLPLEIVNDARPELPTVQRRVYHGRPTPFVNGQPLVWQGYSSYDYAPGSVSEFGRSRTNVFCVPTCAGRHVHNVSAPTWLAPDRFDFGQLDERVGFSLQSNPDGWIVLRASLALPPFWAQQHEDDLVRICTPGGLRIWEETGTRPASFASDAWRRDQASALRELIRHCRQQPWSGRLIGIWLSGGVTEEWFAWGCNDREYSDYGKPSQQRFAAWLHDRFGTDASQDDPMPSPATRNPADTDIFADTADGARSAACQRFMSELSAETVALFARVVKEETAGRCLTGVFYGYITQLAGESRQATAGQFALRQLLDNPDVDMFAGVPLLDFRNLTQGYNPYISATESILAAGKLYCSENDMFSWLHPAIWYTEYDHADPRAGTIAMHRRECANDAVHGAAAQKFSLSASWHHDAALQADFAREQQVYARTQELDRSPAEQIAFVIDDTSFAWVTPGTTYLRESIKLLLYHLGRTGAPVGVWLLSDVDHLPERIRFVVIAHAVAPEPADLAKLQRLLEEGGRTVLVVGLPGLVDPRAGRWRLEQPAKTLGLDITVHDALLPATLLDADGKTLLSAGQMRPRGELSGTQPFHYADGPGAGAERPLPAGGKLIWCGLPPQSSALLRTWAQAAGVHCYAPLGCFVHASRKLVSITSPVGGDVVLQFPEPAEIQDLFDNWTGRGEQTTASFAAGQTRLLQVRPIQGRP